MIHIYKAIDSQRNRIVLCFSFITGTTPAVYRIVENQWYNRETGEEDYVVQDDEVQTVGADNESGKMSPRNLLSTTLTDELNSYVKGSKVIGISIKDRASILPAGHLADGAYWLNIESVNFVTSTWYRKQLPDLVVKFNNKKLPQKYSNDVWQSMLPLNQYKESDPDDSLYDYDTHIPLIFYGWKVPKGLSTERTSVTQIAPTVCSMLHIMFPGGSRDEILQMKLN